MENTTPQPDKIKVFKQDAVFDIKIGVEYYNRFAAALMFYLKDKTQEELQDAANQMMNNDIKDEWVMHYFTFLIFLRTCENYADNNNLSELLTKEEFDVRMQDIMSKVESQEESLKQDTPELITQLNTGLDSEA